MDGPGLGTSGERHGVVTLAGLGGEPVSGREVDETGWDGICNPGQGVPKKRPGSPGPREGGGRKGRGDQSGTEGLGRRTGRGGVVVRMLKVKPRRMRTYYTQKCHQYWMS